MDQLARWTYFDGNALTRLWDWYTEVLVRSGPTVETVHDDDLQTVEWAIEVSYEGSYDLEEDVLADGSKLDEHFSSMGGWIASTLVRLGDLTFDFLPPDEE